MQLRRPTIALVALALFAAGAPAGHAQSASDLEDLIDQQAEQLLQGGDEPEVLDPSESGGVVGGEAPPEDPLEEPDPADDPAGGLLPEATGGGEAGPTPAPPAYLVPGPSAGTMPVSAVASLSEPEVEAEPLRIAGLAAAALAALALAIAAALRALGLREPLASPVTGAAPPTRLQRLSERTTLLADDMRDFLRRQR